MNPVPYGACVHVYITLDPAARAPRSFSLHALEHSTGSERVDAFGLRTVEVIIIMHDHSRYQLTSKASLSLSLSLSASVGGSEKVSLPLASATHKSHSRTL